MTPLARYVASLPERVVRSASAIAGGLTRQVAGIVLPPAVRRTRLHQTLVESTLRFLVEQVGEVRGVYNESEPLPDNFLVRRTAGNGLEAIGLATFHASPVWVLAAFADVSGAGRTLVRDIAETLTREGLLEPGERFDTVEQVLDGLERTSARLAETVNTPPLNVEQLRAELTGLRRDAAALPTPDRLWSLWRDLERAAAEQKRSVFEVSSVMALHALRELPGTVLWLGRSTAVAATRTGEIVTNALLDHYTDTLETMHREGYAAWLARELSPYFRAALRHFSPRHKTLTQRLLVRRRSV